MDDGRVFLNSDDVVVSSSAARKRPARARTPGVRQANATSRLREGSESGSSWESEEEEDDDDEEDEHKERDARLHPHHPYNMRRSSQATHRQGELAVRPGVRGHRSQSRHQPMEFVILPSGEIRPRDECPPGLALPPPSAVGRRLEIGEISSGATERRTARHGESDEESDDEKSVNGQRLQRQRPTVRSPRNEGRTNARRSSKSEPRDREHGQDTPLTRTELPPRRHSRSDREDSVKAPARSQATRTTIPRRRQPLPRTESKSESDSDNQADDDGDSGFASASSFSSEREGVSRPSHGRARLNGDGDEENTRERNRRGDHRDVFDARRSHARRLLDLSHEPHPTERKSAVIRERDATPKGKTRSDNVSRQRTGNEVKTTPSALSTGQMDPAPVYYINDGDKHGDDNDSAPPPLFQSQRRPKPSAPADENIDVERVGIRQTNNSKAIQQLERELQKEKKRVLEKMTLLLEEQGKNQQLHRQIEALESNLPKQNGEAFTRAFDERVRALEEQHAAASKALQEQLELKDAAVLRLQQDKDQLKRAVSKLRRSGEGGEPSRGSSRDRVSRHTEADDADAKRQLEKLAANIRRFLKQVDRWKANSKDAVECCDRKSDLTDLMERMWLDFPQFPGLEGQSEDHDNKAPEVTDENIVRFLKKRLRSREDESRQLQAKYVELKELCARQCVREADLQNFINEHRLRGNLIIRKGSGEDDTAKRKKKPTKQQVSAPSPVSENQGSNGRYYADTDSDDGDNNNAYGSYDHGSGDDDDVQDDDEEDDDEYPIREPRVFVQIGNNGVYEQASGTTSAVREKLADQNRRQGRKKSSSSEVERIRLVPSPSLSQRYERVEAPSPNTQKRQQHTQAQMRPSSMHSRATTARINTTAAPIRGTKSNTMSKPPLASAGRKKAPGNRPWM